MKRICIIGPGVVGLATGKGFLDKGFDVIFWGRGAERVEKLRNEGYKAYTLSEMQNIPYDFEVSLFTVSTPTVLGRVDLSPLRDAAKELGKKLKNTKKYHLVVVKSTVPPGTTENLVTKTIEQFSGKRGGVDFGVCMNPEFLREKSAYEDFVNSRLVLIGELDKKSGDVLQEIYKYFPFPIARVSIKEAEMQKYIHNLFNAVKISFFNEMREACKKIGADAEKIFPTVAISAEGLWNPHYGLRNFGPFDGMCLPKDTTAFLAWAKDNGTAVPILEATVHFNESLKKANGVKKVKHTNGESKAMPVSATEYAI